ncbi:MAG: glycosyltransferase [Ignavibacteriaceae bacterium]|nr:glycosyltransferase [Ignavibacteriaceae bacterium]
MKVLQINSTLNSGSTGRIAEGIGITVIKNGGESYFAYGRSVNPGKSQIIKIGNKWDQFNHVLQTRLFDTNGFHSKTATITFIKQIQQINPDIIHLHNLHGYYLDITVLFHFLKDWKKPIVWTLHDCWSFTGHCCYYERVNCIKWKTECHHCPLKSIYPQSYFFDNSKSNFQKKKALFTTTHNLQLVTVSKWLENQVKDSFMQALPVQTFYNGVDLSVFKPSDSLKFKKEKGLEGKQIILGVANIWSDGKGLDSFIELSKIIKKNQVIILIGTAKKFNKHLPCNIIGIERTNSIEELAKFYNLADVFVNLSIAETFGMVTAEAMACGIPSVVYKTSAMPELITKDVGYIVPLNNYKLLFDRINSILENGKSGYLVNCRNRAEELFDQDKQFEKYISLYKNLQSTYLS